MEFSILIGQYWKTTEPCMLYQHTTKWLTCELWQFLEPWHRIWYEYEIFITSSTDNIYHLEKEGWLFGEVADHVGIYGSRAAEGWLTFNVCLVLIYVNCFCKSLHLYLLYQTKLPWFGKYSRSTVSISCGLHSNVLWISSPVNGQWSNLKLFITVISILLDINPSLNQYAF